MSNRTPSVQLIGKNANNRDVTIRCDINDLPADVEEWIRKAEEEGLPVDAEKTRAAGVVVGNHNGFAGLIAYLAPLEQVHQAARVVNYASKYTNPEARATFLSLVKESQIPIDNLNLNTVLVEIYPSWHKVAVAFGWAPTPYVEDDGFTEVLNSFVDWKGFTQTILERDYPFSTSFETEDGYAGVAVIPA